MARRSARAAGREVDARAFRLSDDLLVEEERAFGTMEAVWVDGIEKARGDLGRAWRAGLTSSAAEEEMARLVRRAGRAADGAAPVFRSLMSAGTKMALDAIGDELRAAEQTLAGRYAGLSVEAVAAVDGDVTDGQGAAAMAVFRAGMAEAVAVFAEGWADEVRVSARLDEPLEVLDRRLFSTSQVSLEGHVGVGAWWKPYQTARRLGREGSIYVVNEARTSAMSWFNTLGEQRG